MLLNSLQDRLGYFFRNRGLLETALCHSSYSNENGSKENNQRLEFLGDSVLGLAVADVLFHFYENAPEGDLSSYRVSFVCRDALLNWAEKLGIPSVLCVGKSLRKNPPPSIFADAAEAVLGAIYLEGGYSEALRVVKKYLHTSERVPTSERDAKSELQYRLQAEDRGAPVYEILSVKGPSHSPRFQVRLLAMGQSWLGEGRSRKAAELEAAQAAISSLENERCQA